MSVHQIYDCLAKKVLGCSFREDRLTYFHQFEDYDKADGQNNEHLDDSSL